MRRSSVSRLALCVLVGLSVGLGGCANMVANIPDAQARAEMRVDQRRDALLERQRARRRALDANLGEKRTSDEYLQDGDRFRADGDNSKAYLSYVRAHLADEDAVVPMRRIGFLALRKDVLQAHSIFRQLAKEQPDDAMVLLGLGISLLATDDLDSAREALLRAIALDPQISQSHATLGVVYDRMQFYREAQRHYRAALELRSSDAQVLNNLGVSHLLADEPEQAEEIFRGALAQGFQNLALQNNLGMALASMKRYDDAFRAFRIAGSVGDASNNLGYAAFLNGDYELAGRLFERALLANDTDEERVLYNLSLLERAR